MQLSARMIMALLLIGLGLTSSDSSGSAKLMPKVAQQKALIPDGANKQDAATPNPDASGVYHVGNGVTAPQAIYSVDPEFSDQARKKKLGGTCIISMVVDATGTPQDVQVSKSIASTVGPKLQSAAKGLDENAIKAAKQYRFKPGTYQGKPVPVEIKVEINYLIY